MAKTICKICGKEFSNLGVHVNKAHRITLEAHNKLEEGESVEKIDSSMLTETNLTEYQKLVEKEEAIKESPISTEDSEIGELGESEVPKIEEASDLTPPTSNITTVDQIRDGVFGEEVVGSGEPLQKLLDEFDVTEKELRAMLRQYKTGSPLPVYQQLKKKQDKGKGGAKELKDEEKLETSDIFVAETFVDKYGFKCIRVDGKKGDSPKVWVLEKIN